MSYGAIPTTDPDAASSDGAGTSSNATKGILLFLALLVAAYLLEPLPELEPVPEPVPEPEPEPVPVPVDPEHWPKALVKMGGEIPGMPGAPPPFSAAAMPQSAPATTAEAAANGWIKTGEPCNPLLGEPWIFGAEQSIDTPATVYFTPEVGETPGVVSAIEVDYYGYLEEKLIGVYFGEEKSSKDGTYRSISVALRNSEDYDLCDTENPIASDNPPYLAIAPDMANILIPTHEESPDLAANWVEGSCLKSMGIHWFQDVETGNELTYKTENTVPVVPMYSSTDGSINGIFFMATGAKQSWPKDCPIGLGPCSVDTNMWDRSPGLLEENFGRFYMCSNLCDAKCQFTGTADGVFTTMHWFFKNTWFGPDAEGCFGNRRFCRNGSSPKMLEGCPTRYYKDMDPLGC
jgi:hypothetical protein